MIKVFPTDLSGMESLTHFFCFDNKLINFPKKWPKSIRHVDLSSNSIISVHSSNIISFTTNLNFLDISSNHIDYISPFFENIPLDTLMVANNRLSDFTFALNLTSLKVLDLSKNLYFLFIYLFLFLFYFILFHRLKSISPDICLLSSTLEKLFLGRNMIESIPSSIGSLEKLTHLDLSGKKKRKSD